MSKTIVAINTLTDIKNLAYSNHLQFAFRLGRNCPEDQFALFTPYRMTIDRCRNEACKVALENEFDYVMFIDDDVLVPFDCYQRLKARDKDVIAGWTVIRGYPYNNMHFKWETKNNVTGLHFYNDHPEDEIKANQGLLRVDAVGCSLTLIKVELLRRLSQPFFVTGTNHTEDIYFCMKVRQEAPDAQIYVDTHVQTAHLLMDNAVEPRNKDLWISHEKKENPALDKLNEPDNTKGDRGLEYLARIGEAPPEVEVVKC